MSKRKRTFIPKQFLPAFKANHRAATQAGMDDSFALSLLNRIKKSNWTDQEAIEALTYLAKFNNEFDKGVLKKGDKAAIHSSDKDRKEIYTRNNERNRDVLTRKFYCLSNINNLVGSEQSFIPQEEMLSFSTQTPTELHPDLYYTDPEDNLIDYLDTKYSKD